MSASVLGSGGGENKENITNGEGVGGQASSFLVSPPAKSMVGGGGLGFNTQSSTFGENSSGGGAAASQVAPLLPSLELKKFAETPWLEFGEVPIDSSSSLSFYLVNPGKAGEIVLEKAASPELSLDATAWGVPAGGKTLVTVTWTPGEPTGNRSHLLVFKWSNGAPGSYRVKVAGYALPSLSASVSSSTTRAARGGKAGGRGRGSITAGPASTTALSSLSLTQKKQAPASSAESGGVPPKATTTRTGATVPPSSGVTRGGRGGGAAGSNSATRGGGLRSTKTPQPSSSKNTPQEPVFASLSELHDEEDFSQEFAPPPSTAAVPHSDPLSLDHLSGPSLLPPPSSALGSGGPRGSFAGGPRRVPSQQQQQQASTSTLSLSTSSSSLASTMVGVAAASSITDESFTVQQLSSSTIGAGPKLPPRKLLLHRALTGKGKESASSRRIPFLSNNAAYDDNYIDKQERAFVKWINFTLLPPQIEEAAAATGAEAMTLAMYTQERQWEAVRRAACKVACSASFVDVMTKVNSAVADGRFRLRPSLNLLADIGEQEKFIAVLQVYNYPWLRLAAEVTFGEGLPATAAANPKYLATFFHDRLFTSFSEAEACNTSALKRVLHVILLLDTLKKAKVMPLDPILFCRSQEHKSSKEVLLEVARLFMSGEGDMVRHLGLMGARLSHEQTAWEEVDLTVKNLSVDLTDGVRLCRLIDVLSGSTELVKNLRLPASSKVQKTHNVEVALEALRNGGDASGVVRGCAIAAKDIVEGHREKTLALLWQLIVRWSISALVNVPSLYAEIDRVERAHPKSGEWRTSDVYYGEEFMTVLLEWAQVVCGVFEFPVHNFTVSFSDGRALCYLVHFYHPALLPREDIDTRTTYHGSQDQEDKEREEREEKEEERERLAAAAAFAASRSGAALAATGGDNGSEGGAASASVSASGAAELSLHLLNGSSSVNGRGREAAPPSNALVDGQWVKTFSPTIGGKHAAAIKAEKANFRTFQRAIRKLGAIPSVIHALDMSNTIPDEKVVVTALAYLSSRLLSLSHETRAASVIQYTWRVYVARREVRRREEAATTIQRAWRAKVGEEQAARLAAQSAAAAVAAAKAAETAALERLTVRLQARRRALVVHREFLAQREAAIRVQGWTRTVLAVRRLKATRAAVVQAQAAVRGWLVRSGLARQARAATVIAASWKGLEARRSFKAQRTAALRVQAFARMALARSSFVRVRDAQREWNRLVQAVVKIQAFARMATARATYCKVHNGVVRLQARARGAFARSAHRALTRATVLAQARVRGKEARRLAATERAHVVKTQALARRYLARSAYVKALRSVTLAQAGARGWLARRELARRSALVASQRTEAAALIQAAFRGLVARKSYVLARRSAVTVQAAARMFLARRTFVRAKSAATLVQAAARGFAARKAYSNLRQAAVAVQAWFRMVSAARAFKETRAAAVSLQALARGVAARKAYLRDRTRVIKVQALVRRHQAIKQRTLATTAVVTLQRSARSFLAKKALAELRTARNERLTNEAATTLSAAWRGRRERLAYRSLRFGTVMAQAHFRGRTARKAFVAEKAAALTLQSQWRTLAQRRAYLAARSAVIRLQATVRARAERTAFLRLKAGTVRAQALLRGSLARRDFAANKAAAIVVQAAWRGRAQALAYRRLHKAAVCVQARRRGLVAVRAFSSLKAAAAVIQDRWRFVRAARCAAAQKAAALTIQRVFRGWLGRRAAKTEAGRARQRLHSAVAFATSFMAAVRVQRTFRAWRCKSAATAIQAAWRGLQGRRTAEAARAQATRRVSLLVRAAKAVGAVLALQRAFRYKAAVKRANKRCALLIKVAKAVQAVRAVQRAFRALRARRASVLVLQSAWRGRQGRLAARAVRTQVAARTARLTIAARAFLAAVTVQRAVRAWHRRRAAQAQAAATAIQAVARGYLARKAVSELKAAHAARLAHFTYVARAVRASMVLQRAFRRYRARNAAVKIQAQWRGFAGRRLVCSLRAATAERLARLTHIALAFLGAVRIQRTFRLFRCSRAALKLQTAVRGWLARKDLAARKAARDRRQSELVRKGTAGRAILAVIRFQRLYRNHAAKKRALAQLASLVSVQRWVRARLARLAFVRQRQAARTIQGCVRRWLALRTKSAIVIQSATRGFLARLHYARFREAVVRLQARFRGRLVRAKSSKAVRSALKRIAAANAKAEECMTLGKRTAAALEVLLSSKALTHVMKACKNLEVSTRLSKVCCEHMLHNNAIAILFALVRSCNRSKPHMELLVICLNIFRYLAAYESTAAAVFAVQDSVDTLTELMQMYRDNDAIFFRATKVVRLLCESEARARDVHNTGDVIRRMQSLQSILERKEKMEKKFVHKAGETSMAAAGTSFVSATPSKAGGKEASESKSKAAALAGLLALIHERFLSA